MLTSVLSMLSCGGHVICLSLPLESLSPLVSFLYPFAKDLNKFLKCQVVAAYSQLG